MILAITALLIGHIQRADYLSFYNIIWFAVHNDRMTVLDFTSWEHQILKIISYYRASCKKIKLRGNDTQGYWYQLTVLAALPLYAEFLDFSLNFMAT